MRDILRYKKDLTPEMIQKINSWLKTLTKEDFLNAKYDAKHLAKEKKLETCQTIGDVIHFGTAQNEKVIRFGEVFLVDSKYANGDLCIVEHLRSKKGHKILYKLATNYKNYSCGYFAIPVLD